MSKWMIITVVTAVLAGGLGFVGGLLVVGRSQSADETAAQPDPQAAIETALQQMRDETDAVFQASNEKLQKTIDQLNQTTESVNQLNELVNQLRQENNVLADELSRLQVVTADPNAVGQTGTLLDNAANIETPKMTSKTSQAKTADTKTQANATRVFTGDIIVYVTKTGKKYHRTDCSSLSKSKIPMKLSEAKARGYTPCQRCKPPGE
ncbi:hypothetical protein ACFL02_09645 [Planctomycetota bacterium]